MGCHESRRRRAWRSLCTYSVLWPQLATLPVITDVPAEGSSFIISHLCWSRVEVGSAGLSAPSFTRPNPVVGWPGPYRWFCEQSASELAQVVDWIRSPAAIGLRFLCLRWLLAASHSQLLKVRWIPERVTFFLPKGLLVSVSPFCHISLSLHFPSAGCSSLLSGVTWIYPVRICHLNYTTLIPSAKSLHSHDQISIWLNN